MSLLQIGMIGPGDIWPKVTQLNDTGKKGPILCQGKIAILISSYSTLPYHAPNLTSLVVWILIWPKAMLWWPLWPPPEKKYSAHHIVPSDPLAPVFLHHDFHPTRLSHAELVSDPTFGQYSGAKRVNWVVLSDPTMYSGQTGRLPSSSRHLQPPLELENAG